MNIMMLDMKSVFEMNRPMVYVDLWRACNNDYVYNWARNFMEFFRPPG